MNSYWMDFKINSSNDKKIDGNYKADVCIIGAGMAGLSIAYYLVKNGLSVIVVDKDGIGEKASGHTTAKITLQHNLIYDYLINSFGLDYAVKYFDANRQAILNIKQIINKENIDCDFESVPNCFITTSLEPSSVTPSVTTRNLL